MWKSYSKHARGYFKDIVRVSNFKIVAIITIGLSVAVALALAYVAPAHACPWCPRSPP